MPKNSYNYGSSLISTNYRFEFRDDNVKYTKINNDFFLELKVYCGRKKMYVTSKNYKNVTINYAIKNLFQTEVEKQCIFHKGKNYYATFKVYEVKDVKRYAYKKTDTLINSKRRKYLLQERINIYL